MKEIESGTLTKKMESIQRGVYYFGIIGRLSVLYGTCCFIFGIMFLVIDGVPRINESGIHCLVSSLPALINGWLFLMGRDAFEAIHLLIKEMGEIV